MYGVWYNYFCGKTKEYVLLCVCSLMYGPMFLKLGYTLVRSGKLKKQIAMFRLQTLKWEPRGKGERRTQASLSFETSQVQSGWDHWYRLWKVRQWGTGWLQDQRRKDRGTCCIIFKLWILKKQKFYYGKFQGVQSRKNGIMNPCVSITQLQHVLTFSYPLNFLVCAHIIY